MIVFCSFRKHFIFSLGPDDAEIPMNIPKELAIKIFKTTLNEFKNRDKYIKDDYRFRDRFSKQNPRKVTRCDSQSS